MPRAGDKLKEWRKGIYDLRRAGNSWEEIAKGAGKTVNVVKKAVTAAIDRDGLEPFEIPPDSSFERKNPELAGEILADYTNGQAHGEHEKKTREALREAMKNAGMKPNMIAGFMKRLRTTYAPMTEAAQRLTTQELIKQLEQKMSMTLGFMDEFAASQASFKDLSIALGLMVDRHQLVSGKPTMILDHTTRQTLPTLIGGLLAEASRRGITLDNPPQSEFAPKLVEQ